MTTVTSSNLTVRAQQTLDRIIAFQHDIGFSASVPAERFAAAFAAHLSDLDAESDFPFESMNEWSIFLRDRLTVAEIDPDALDALRLQIAGWTSDQIADAVRHIEAIAELTRAGLHRAMDIDSEIDQAVDYYRQDTY